MDVAHASTRGPIFKRILPEAAAGDWSSVIKWWRGVFHAVGTEVTDSLTSLELELEWALECPDTSRVYFTKCSWPEQEKSGERGGKKWKRWGKMKRREEDSRFIRVWKWVSRGFVNCERESNQEKGVDDRQAAMERAMGSSTIFTRC